MTLLVCAATGPELAGLLPDFAPPLTAAAQSGEVGAAAAPADWPEMQLWPVRLKAGNALCCITGIGPINAALAMGRLGCERFDLGGYSSSEGYGRFKQDMRGNEYHLMEEWLAV